MDNDAMNDPKLNSNYLTQLGESKHTFSDVMNDYTLSKVPFIIRSAYIKMRCIAQLENTEVYWTDQCSRS